MLFPELERERPPENALTIVAYGGGVNSTAMLCGWVERGVRPVDLILFSDTGGERPRTYAYGETFTRWLEAHGLPPIVTVRKVNEDGEAVTLEDDCLNSETLPSLAYGFKRCSQKFKLGPQEKYVNHWQPAMEAWARGERVVKLVGYDADEPHRASNAPGQQQPKYWLRYPLIEWGWGRTECLAAIQRAGLPTPGKSACFFCPANTKSEIKQLQAEYPDLLQRALAIEDNARGKFQTVEGLGRRFSWRDLIDGKPLPLFSETELPCDCYDGAADDEAA